MTHLQKLIRNIVQEHGSYLLATGRTRPANMNTIKSLRKAGYQCQCVALEKDSYGNEIKTFRISL